MKPFDLEKALAGEPVKLRNESKAYVKYVMPNEHYIGEYPMRGYIIDDTLPNNICEKYWTKKGNGYNDLGSESGTDIVGMWEEPRPRVQLDLPAPLKEPQEGMYVIDSNFEIRASDFKDGYRYSTKAFAQGRYFATREDAQEWINAMKGARR